MTDERLRARSKRDADREATAEAGRRALIGAHAAIDAIGGALGRAVNRRELSEFDGWILFHMSDADILEWLHRKQAATVIKARDRFAAKVAQERGFVARGAVFVATKPRKVAPDSLEPACFDGCARCSGEYCDRHHSAPCGCDVVERHTDSKGRHRTYSPA